MSFLPWALATLRSADPEVIHEAFVEVLRRLREDLEPMELASLWRGASK